MRRTAREIALKMLFQKEFTTSIPPREWLNHIHDEESAEQPKIAKESLQFAEILVSGVTQFQQDIDSSIKTCAQHWSISRMATIDRNILRLGVFEMQFAKQPTPVTVAINEAVELAKIFGTKESAGFVNGILDQVQKNMNTTKNETSKDTSFIKTQVVPVFPKSTNEITASY